MKLLTTTRSEGYLKHQVRMYGKRHRCEVFPMFCSQDECHLVPSFSDPTVQLISCFMLEDYPHVSCFNFHFQSLGTSMFHMFISPFVFNSVFFFESSLVVLFLIFS